ncbi:MAG: molybdopterin molybdenumtransferase MoeA [Methanobacterium sp.]|nr:molybdopterin molybdenumtransferase MoeA [Methanobacterium sp.]
MGKEFLKIIDPEDAQNTIAKLPINKTVEKVPLDEAYKRVLAEDIYAIINLPPFRRAAMDGYALKSKDTFHASEDEPVTLKLKGLVTAGKVPETEVTKGTCMEVSTGAPIPEGADAVVMIEYTEKQGDNVLISEGVPLNANITKEGSDIRKGELLLSQGVLITSDKIGVLSAIGMTQVPVYIQPRVAVISTGNEIIKHDQNLVYGKIYDINSYSISNAVKSCGCIPVHSEIVKDDYDSLKSSIKKYKDADIIITSGGTSAGAGDNLRTVLDELGKVLVHGIAVKPGKPTIIGLIEDEGEEKIIFGLPGYPVSALMIFRVFITPFLRKLASLPDFDQERKLATLKISRRYIAARGRQQYVLVKIKDNQAHPILKDSGAITSLAEADGYFLIPKNVEIIEEGTEVDVYSLEI